VDLKDDNTILKSLDVNYSNQYDVEEDISGDNIQGRRLTVYELTPIINEDTGEETLSLKITIFSDEERDNPNFVHAVREFVGVK
jgi:hypothetical protein